MRKILFIDRDGTLLNEPEDFQIDSLEKWMLVPGCIQALHRLQNAGYEFHLVTNQDGLGTDIFPWNTFLPAHQLFLNTLAGEGIIFKEILIDTSFEWENKNTRKPGTGMFSHYNWQDIDLESSYVIGDRATDIQLAGNLGIKSVLLARNAIETPVFASIQQQYMPDFSCVEWQQIAEYILRYNRRACIQRNTAETQCTAELWLDVPEFICTISTGIGFFDHMLQQLIFHAGAGLHYQVHGDLHIDEHHTIEDTAITLGKAFAQALYGKNGLERYGSAEYKIAMDEAGAECILDISGRPFLQWDAEFKREKIGEMPTEMIQHFFYSFCIAAGMTIHIRAYGYNEHHKAEAIFKAVGNALRKAAAITRNNSLPSTKGIL
jgi:imidazoleglycerol-phosphate dehydratase/histidinol-phosphatase